MDGASETAFRLMTNSYLNINQILISKCLYKKPCVMMTRINLFIFEPSYF